MGVGVTRSYYKQSGDDSYENYSFNPRLVLHYTLPGNSFVRWKSDISNASPSLGDLSAVEQIVDSLPNQTRQSELEKPICVITQS